MKMSVIRHYNAGGRFTGTSCTGNNSPERPDLSAYNTSDNYCIPQAIVLILFFGVIFALIGGIIGWIIGCFMAGDADCPMRCAIMFSGIGIIIAIITGIMSSKTI
ncbi:MAG: hypothetical protein V1661_02170 [bacterium]